MTRVLPMDLHYGAVGLSDLALSAADTFTAVQISDDIISPDVVIDEDLFTSEGDLDIQEILTWDCARFEWGSVTSPTVVAGQNKVQSSDQGLVLDNRVEAILPTNDSSAQQTRASGNELGTESRFVDRVNHMKFANEENAVGEIDKNMWRPSIVTEWPRSWSGGGGAQGSNYGYVMTAAHYHHWGDGSGMTPNVAGFELGMKARRISIEFLELMFDRQTIIGILNAVGQIF